ncbi:MAG: hypothetical protein ACRBBW_21275 [Cellvibrionaceae bacterium]
MSLKNHIVTAMDHGQRLLETITPLPAAKEYPCGCCGGRGAVATIMQFYRFDRELTPVEKMRGGEVRAISAMRCPACQGKGVDSEAMLNDAKGAA